MKLFAFFVIITMAAAESWLPGNVYANPGNGGQAEAMETWPSYRVAGFVEQNFTWQPGSDEPPSFSIHRARLGVAGNVSRRISVSIIAGALEPPNRDPQLVNAFVDFNLHPMFRLRTGQFLVPFGLEGPEPVFLNPAIERSLTIRRMNYFRMFRDVGIQASGSHEGVSYTIAVINGTGANIAERIDPKDILGRFGYKASDAFSFGISFHLGKSPVPATEPDRFQLGADFTWQSSPLLLRGEYILRKDERIGENDLNQSGGYLLAGYNLTEELQGILRFEAHQPNADLDFSDAGLTILMAGFNYYFEKGVRVSANYEFRNDRSLAAGQKPGNLLTVQMQVVL